MKPVPICLLFLFLFIISAGQSNSFRVTIQLPDSTTIDTIFLEYRNPDNVAVTDTLLTTTSEPVFAGRFSQPWIAAVIFKREVSDRKIRSRHEFFLSSGETRIVFSSFRKPSTISGSTATELFVSLQDSLNQIQKRLEPLIDKSINAEIRKDTLLMSQIDTSIDSIERSEKKRLFLGFIENNSASELSIYLLSAALLEDRSEPRVYLEYFDKLSRDSKESPMGVLLQQRLLALAANAIGNKATDFIQFDPNGKKVRLSDQRGKYILVDFWASWCVPCRNGHPKLVEVYRQNANKNFTIISVALEREEDKRRWLEAITLDRLSWTQVTDFKFWKNAAALAYGIESIPSNVLIDTKGKIIAKNLSPDELEITLAKILR